MRWSARITACLVRAGPIRCSKRGTLCQLMFMPSPISGTRIWASRAMTRKSSATASATPPPIQKPSMAAMVICSISCQARESRGPSLRCRRKAPISMVFRERPSASLRSKPSETGFALPVSTTTEVAPSSSKLRAALVSCRTASGDNALMPSPRSKRTTAIRPSGPKPLSIFTKSANRLPPFPAALRAIFNTIAHKVATAQALLQGQVYAGSVAKALCSAPTPVFTFRDLFDDLGAERIQIAWIARRNHTLVDDDFGIFPIRTGILDVRLDRLVGRHLAPLRDAGFDQQPRRVADRGDDLLLVEDVLDER